MSYGIPSNERQDFPIVEETSKGPITIEDARRPDQRPRLLCTDYRFGKYTEVQPINNVNQFSSGLAQKIQFNVSTLNNMLIDWSKSYFQYQIQIIKSDGKTELTKTDACNATYAGFANLVQSTGVVSSSAGGAASNAATTCSCVYMRNSMTPFYSFEIADRDSGRNIEEFTSPNSPGLMAQLMLGCQPPEFWTGTQSPDQGQSESKADVYGATVRTFRDEGYYFKKVATTGNSISPEGIMPIDYVSSASGGIVTSTASVSGVVDVGPVANPYATTFCTFPEVQQQQLKLWSSATNEFDGMPLRTVPISDLLQENQLQYGYFNKYLITFTVNSYNNAITDFISTCTSASNGTWTSTQNAASFNLYNVKMIIYYLECNENVIQRLMTLASSQDGIQIPFAKAIWKTASWAQSQNTFTISINQQNITDLQRVVFIFRNSSSSSNSGGYDAYMFRNMSTGFIPAGTNIPVPTASMISLGTWNKTTKSYNGLNQFWAKWQMIQLPSEQITYIAPYQFARMKEAYAGCFADPKDTHVSKYLFEGIDQNGFWNNCTTQFCIALDLRTVAGSEKNGISLAKSPLDVTFVCANTAPTTTFQIDYVMFVGCTCHVTSSRVYFDN